MAKKTTTTAVAAQGGIPAHAAEMVTQQYHKALASYTTALVDSLRMGGMLIQIESTLDEGHANQHGVSLKSWLESNCPDVNYQKAIKFKTLAEGLKVYCQIPRKVPLDVILPGSDSADVESQTGIAQKRIDGYRRACADFLEGKSARQLEFAFGVRADPTTRGGMRDGSGRPSTADVSAETRAGATWAILGKGIDHATSWNFARFLPEAIALEALETATMLRDALKARVDELKKGR